MYNRDIIKLQMWVWTASAMTAPLAVSAGRSGWPWVLLLGVLCGSVCQVVLMDGNSTAINKAWYYCLQFAWLAFALGTAVRWSALCWPSDSSITAGVILLLLSASAAICGRSRAAAVCSVLSWGVGLLYLILILAGLSNMEIKWLVSEKALAGEFPAELIFIFLIPAGMHMLEPQSNRRPWIGSAVMLSFGLVLSFLTIGGLSASAGERYAFAFYEFSKSLQLVGSVKRFEALAAVVMTAGFFALESLLLIMCKSSAEKIRQGKGKQSVWIASAIALVATLMGGNDSSLILAAGSLVFWGVVPVSTIVTARIKSLKKSKKVLDNE